MSARGRDTLGVIESGALTPQAFLSEYWQRRPCLVRRAFPDFRSPVDGDDLAGLACEEYSEARIVTGSHERGDWTLEYGPFDEGRFTRLGARDWTLLVQDVEKHFPALQPLMDRFAFLPAWRLDDLMVSFAAPGGSVGPHVDQYDVFLLQAHGRRRWAIARQFDPDLLEDCPLRVLAGFQAERAWTLEPGDMLYLPPGVAHHGVALDACLTFSVGLRAPSAADLFLALGEQLAERDDQGGRYADPGLTMTARAGEIDAQALRRFRQLLDTALEDGRKFEALVAAFLSRFRSTREPEPATSPPSPDDLCTAGRDGRRFLRDPWTRLNWIERNGRALLFASGQAQDCSIAMAEALCGPEPARLDPESLDATSRETLRQLLMQGHLHLEPP